MKNKKCKDRAPEISALIDGELPEKKALELERHLKICSECKCLYEELIKTSDLIAESYSHASGIDLSGVWKNIEAGFEPQTKLLAKIISIIFRPMVWLPAAAVAAALLLFVMPGGKINGLPEISRVESVYSETGRVIMVKTAQSKNPVIWIMPDISG